MTQVVGMAEAKSKLAEIVGKVKYGKQTIILQRRGQPMAILISIEEYERLRSAAHIQTDEASPLPPRLLKRQRALVARAQRLREQRGDPVDRLASLLADLPPDEDDFWMEVEEAR